MTSYDSIENIRAGIKTDLESSPVNFSENIEITKSFVGHGAHGLFSSRMARWQKTQTMAAKNKYKARNRTS